MLIKWNYKLVKEYIENLGMILISEKYKNARTPLIIKDNCGYMYYVSLDSLKRRNIPTKFYMSNPYTLHNIKLWCTLNNKTYELIDYHYKSNDTLMKWKCLKENYKEEFLSKWTNIQTGYGCPYCANQKVGVSNCLSTTNPELAKQWHPTLNGDLTPYDFVSGSHNEVWWQCSKNPKHEWKSIIYNRNRGNDCPYCIKTCGGYTLASYNYNLLICNPKVSEEWNYKKNDKRPEEYTPVSGQYVWWICKECKHEWNSRIADRDEGCGCPKCNESKGEKKIKDILSNFNISHDKEYTFDDLIGLGGGLLRFDVSVF